jgi:hypothetical protein
MKQNRDPKDVSEMYMDEMGAFDSAGCACKLEMGVSLKNSWTSTPQTNLPFILYYTMHNPV